MDRKKNTTSPYPAEFRERAVQMVVDHLDSYESLTAAVRDIAGKLGCSPDSLRVWYKQSRRDAVRPLGPSSAEKARIMELERGNRELRRGEEGREPAGGRFPDERDPEEGRRVSCPGSKADRARVEQFRRCSTARSAKDCVH